MTSSSHIWTRSTSASWSTSTRTTSSGSITVRQLSFYTTAPLEGSVTPDHVMEDWLDWYQLVPAFVATYGSDELRDLEGGAVFLGAIEEDEDVSLTEAYLKDTYWKDISHA